MSIRVLGVVALVILAYGSATGSGFYPGTGAELRVSENYMIADTLGQFVVGRSSVCTDGIDPMQCSYSCAIIEHGFWHSDISIPTLSETKQTPDYQPVVAYARTVSAGNDQLYRTFYIEEPDRLSAIRVNVGVNPSIHVSEGDMVDVSGIIKTSLRERYIDAPEVIVRFQSSARLSSYFASNRWLGGGGTDAVVSGGCGPNTIGVLAKTSGTVTYVDTAIPSRFFYTDDGSGLSDGSVIGGKAMRGLRVQTSNLATGNTILPPPVGSCVTVTGICVPQSATGGRIVAQLRPRTQADIQVIPQ